jgi:asparagine synthase (glutamine-hydrolysing)
MLTRLNGIFAFAMWDAGKRALFLARDGLRVKPLYYAQTPQGFLFASEIKALLQEPMVSRRRGRRPVRSPDHLWLYV